MKESVRPVNGSRPATPNDRAEISREILAAFRGQIEPFKTPITYRLAALVVAIVMILLPILYLGIIALVGYGVYYHTVHHTAMIGAGRGRAVILSAIAYLAPMIIGVILVVFMFKPLFSRPSRGGKNKSLSRKDEPLVFALAEFICDAVGSPKPKRIDIDGQVNASASFRRGMLSMFGRDLVLTIGLPLVAGLNLREFAGVLAHEFGHFSQGAGMRLTYIIRSISHWFQRVVYERDRWDDILVEMSGEWDIRIGWVLYLARLFVWLTRKILWVLMLIGQVVSGYLLRQMEFDADRYQAQFAGSDVNESTSKKLMALTFADQKAHADLSDFYREGRLVDNLPQLVIHNVQQFSSEAIGSIDELINESETGWLDSHPCTRERIAAAKKENAPGIFRRTDPATIVFRDFDATSREATWHFYQEVFDGKLSRDEVHPVEELLTRQNEQQDTFEALHRCFQGTYRLDRPVAFPSWYIEATKDVDGTADELLELRNQILTDAASYQEICRRFDEASVEDEGAIVPEFAAFEKILGKRLHASLALLHTDEIAESLEEAPAWREECDKLLPICRRLNNDIPQLVGLARENNVMAALFSQLSEARDNEELAGIALAQVRIVYDLAMPMRDTLPSIRYPFDHAKSTISIGEFALKTPPHREDPGQVHSAADSLVDSANMVRARILGRFCQMAEAVESSLGLDPLPMPQPAEEGVAAE